MYSDTRSFREFSSKLGVVGVATTTEGMLVAKRIPHSGLTKRLSLISVPSFRRTQVVEIM
jgi:hypothetical protein